MLFLHRFGKQSLCAWHRLTAAKDLQIQTQTQYSQCTQTWHSPSGHRALETDYSGHTQAAESGLRFPHRADSTSGSAKSLYVLCRVNRHSSLHSTRGSARALAHTSWISFRFRLRKVRNSNSINWQNLRYNTFILHEMNHPKHYFLSTDLLVFNSLELPFDDHLS